MVKGDWEEEEKEGDWGERVGHNRLNPWPLLPAKSWKFKHSNPIKTDTEGAIESVDINGVSLKRVFALMQTGPFIKHS